MFGSVLASAWERTWEEIGTTQEEILSENGLTSAVGSAIAELVKQEIQQCNPRHFRLEMPRDTEIRQDLTKLANFISQKWSVTLLESQDLNLQPLSLSELGIRETDLPKFFFEAQLNALDEPTWEEILNSLHEKVQLRRPQEVIATLTPKLHAEFHQQLRKVLQAEFQESKAFAGLAIVMWTEIHKAIASHHNSIIQEIKPLKSKSQTICQLLHRLERQSSLTVQQVQTIQSQIHRESQTIRQQITSLPSVTPTDIQQFVYRLEVSFQGAISAVKQDTEQLLQGQSEVKQDIQQLSQRLASFESTLEPKIPAISPPNERLERILFKRILKLNFSQQQKQFQRVIQSQKIAAFLVHGQPAFGQQALVHLLRELIPGESTAKRIPLKVSNTAIATRRISLWRYIAGEIKATTTEEIPERVCEWWETEDVLFTIDGIEAMLPELLVNLIEDLWKPIVEKAYQYWQNDPDKYQRHLILFLVDNQGNVCDSGLAISDDPNHQLYPWIPLPLEPNCQFTTKDLDKWIEEAVNDEVLLPGLTANHLLKLPDVETPEDVYWKICEHCNTSWEGQLAKWLV